MLRNLLLKVALAGWNPRGKQRFLDACDRLLGESIHTTPDHIQLLTEYANQQTLSFFNEANNPRLNALIQSLNPGDIFLDVGANVGYYTLKASRRVGPEGLCIAVEPSRREHAKLQRHCTLNAAENVVTLNMALSDAPSILQLAVARRHAGLNVLGDRANLPSDFLRVEKVAVGTVDTVVRPLCGTREVAVAKIDVEGAEVRVLRGMKRMLAEGQIRQLCVEVTAKFLARFGNTVDEMYDLMTDCGYQAACPQQAWQYDEVFIRSDVAGSAARAGSLPAAPRTT